MSYNCLHYLINLHIQSNKTDKGENRKLKTETFFLSKMVDNQSVFSFTSVYIYTHDHKSRKNHKGKQTIKRTL